jgi:GAF domain-containing protein
MELPGDLRQHVDRVNRLLATQNTMPAKLEAVAEILERTVPRCDAVSVAFVLEEAAVTGAASSQLAIEADIVQYAHNQGPCLTAVKKRSPVRIDVLRHDERFEHFAPGALELGVESVLSVPVLWMGSAVGSLNIYSYEPNAFTQATLDQVAPIADYAAEVIAHSPLFAASLDLVEGLVATVSETNDIETAVGFLLGMGCEDKQAALAALRSNALEAGISLVDAARRVITRMPTKPHPSEA